MFSFLNPWLLWALPASCAPVVLHWLFLRRARVVRFSDLTLLEAAYRRSLPSSRLRQWLLLAARCLILAFLILAFARPVWQPPASSPPPAGEEEGLRLVMLLDVSYSMRYRVHGRSRFESAIAAGRALLRSLGPHDRAAVLAFSDRVESPPEGPPWRSGSDAASVLGRFSPGYRGTDYFAALESAFGILAESRSRRRAIVVLSDNAAHGLRSAELQPLPRAPASRVPALGRGLGSADSRRWVESVPGYDPAAALLGLGWPDAPDNAAVVSVEPGPERPDGSQTLTARAALSGPARPSWELSLWQGERREEEKRLSLAPGRAQEASFVLRAAASRSPAPGGGYGAWGRLELRADALAEDDAFYYSLWAQPRPKVLLAFGGARSMQAGRGGYFLKKLFVDPRGSLLPFDLEIADLGRLQTLRLQDFQAVVLLDFRSVSPGLGSALERYVRSGGGLWMIAAPWENPRAYRSLDGILPARWMELLDFQGANALKAEPVPPEPDSRFSWKDFDLSGVSVRRAYLLRTEPDAKVWLRDSGGRPLLVSGTAGSGRVFLWAASLDVDWTNAALKPVFAPWVDWTLGRLTGFSRRREWRTVRVGDTFVRVWRPEEPAPSSARVVGPDRRPVNVRVARRRLEYQADAPGLYFIESPAGADAFAANLDRSSGESDLAPLAAPPWRLLRPEAAREDFQRFLFGREAGGAGLGIVLLLLLAELWLSGAPAARPLAAAVLCCALVRPAAGQDGGKFAWTQARYEGDWDPHPGAFAEVLASLTGATSVTASPDRKTITWNDPALFSSPLVVLAGRQAPPSLSDEELKALRSYLVSGGLLWIEDASGLRASPFDRWVRQTLRLVFPESDLSSLGQDHVIYKTFFLMRGVGGRTMVSEALEGVDWNARTAVVYSRNDILGALAKDALGRPLFECVPGGEPQRRNARKLALNIVMYALTGNYKADAVHQPYLLMKMRQGVLP